MSLAAYCLRLGAARLAYAAGQTAALASIPSTASPSALAVDSTRLLTLFIEPMYISTRPERRAARTDDGRCSIMVNGT